jgi:hypothetical protein
MELGDAFYVKNRVDKSRKAFRKQARTAERWIIRALTPQFLGR